MFQTIFSDLMGSFDKFVFVLVKLFAAYGMHLIE